MYSTNQDRRKTRTTRRYRLDRRLASTARTRARLLAATRRLLMTRNGLTHFSLEAVAKRAGVTRLTVYHQFGSKAGLLESVYDDLARRGKIVENFGAAFQSETAEECLDRLVSAFVYFWNSERLVLKRLRSMAVLDPEFKGGPERDALRRQAVQTTIRRLAGERHRQFAAEDDKTTLVTMLTGFETFDALAGTKPDVLAITTQIQGLVRKVLELEPPNSRQKR